jgi:hypothetical protein
LADWASRSVVRVVVVPQTAGGQEADQRRERRNKQHSVSNCAQRIVASRHRTSLE